MSDRTSAPAWLVELAPRIKVVFSDLDGTLFDAQHRVPTRTTATVRRLHACGIRFAPATGRTALSLRELFGPLADEIDYVAGNGTEIVVDGELVYHQPYPREDAKRLFAAVAASTQHMGFVTFDEQGGHIANLEADFIRSNIESLSGSPICPDELLFAGKELGKVGVVATQGAQAAVDELTARLGSLFTFAPTGPNWIDVLVKGTDKAQGIARMLDHLGISPCETLAFGDSMNDESMMKLLPHTVAVSNAMPHIQKLCAYHIGSNRDEAVLDCLDQLCDLREQNT